MCHYTRFLILISLVPGFLGGGVVLCQESFPYEQRRRWDGPAEQFRGGGPRPPWMQGGPERAGGNNRGPREGRGDAGARTDRALNMLRGMDTNGNGILETHEIPEQRRGFVGMMVSRLGGNPNGNINLNALARQGGRQQAPRSGGRSGGYSGPANWLSGGRSDQSPSATTALGQRGVANDPLVPYFGETATGDTPVLAFGQREAETKAAGTAANAVSGLSRSDQILRSAREQMNKYDKNKNGTLDKDKGEWVASLPFKPDAADSNLDGRISMTEIIAVLGGTSGVSSGAAAVATRQSTAYERIPAGMPDWFFARDKEQDGQLTMQEYGTGQPWTEALVGEFEFLDRNNDGVATGAEIFAALKEFDEKKLLQEEQAKREIARRKGAPAPGAENNVENAEIKNTDVKPAETVNTEETRPVPQAAQPALPTTGPYAEASAEKNRPSGRRNPRSR